VQPQFAFGASSGNTNTPSFGATGGFSGATAQSSFAAAPAPTNPGTVRPQSPVAKLLLLVSMLFKGNKLTEQHRATLKQLIFQNNPSILCALEVFEIDQDFDELADTLVLICSNQ